MIALLSIFSGRFAIFTSRYIKATFSAPPTAFSASTRYNYILFEASSYPLCTIPGHGTVVGSPAEITDPSATTSPLSLSQTQTQPSSALPPGLTCYPRPRSSHPIAMYVLQTSLRRTICLRIPQSLRRHPSVLKTTSVLPFFQNQRVLLKTKVPPTPQRSLPQPAQSLTFAPSQQLRHRLLSHSSPSHQLVPSLPNNTTPLIP